MVTTYIYFRSNCDHNCIGHRQRNRVKCHNIINQISCECIKLSSLWFGSCYQLLLLTVRLQIMWKADYIIIITHDMRKCRRGSIYGIQWHTHTQNNSIYCRHRYQQSYSTLNITFPVWSIKLKNYIPGMGHINESTLSLPVPFDVWYEGVIIIIIFWASCIQYQIRKSRGDK